MQTQQQQQITKRKLISFFSCLSLLILETITTTTGHCCCSFGKYNSIGEFQTAFLLLNYLLETLNSQLATSFVGDLNTSTRRILGKFSIFQQKTQIPSYMKTSKIRQKGRDYLLKQHICVIQRFRAASKMFFLYFTLWNGNYMSLYQLQKLNRFF